MSGSVDIIANLKSHTSRAACKLLAERPLGRLRGSNSPARKNSEPSRIRPVLSLLHRGGEKAPTAQRVSSLAGWCWEPLRRIGRSRDLALKLGFNSTMFCYGAYDQVPAPCNRIGRVRVTHSSYNGQSLCYSSVTAPLHPPLQLRYSPAPAPLQLRYTLRYSSVTPSVTAPLHPPLHPPLQLRYSSVTPSVTAPLQLRYSSVTAYDTAPLQLRYTLRYSSVTPSVTAPLQLRYTLRYSSATAPLQLRYSSVTPSVTAPLHPPLHPPLQLRYSSVTPSVTAPLHPPLQLRYSL